jgi:hypothetical protein
MKKITALILAMIMVLALSACGKKEEPAGPAATATEAPTAGTAQTATPEPTAAPTDVPSPTEIPLPENPGDFAASTGSFFWDQSSELHNILISIYPVDDKKAVIQLTGMEATEDSDIVTETNCSLTFELVNKAVYRNDEADMTLTIDNENNVAVIVGGELYSELAGNYLPSNGMSWLYPDTILEYLRNIPDSGIGDFGKAGKADEVEESVSNNWFHELNLYRGDDVFGIYVAAEDFSAICRVNDLGELDLIYGSMANTLEQTDYYEFYIGNGGEEEEENEEEFVYYEQPLIYPYILCGADMTVGQSDYVVVMAPWDMTEDIKGSSRDETDVTVNDTEITAVGAGEAILDVELVYGGCTKQYTIEVSVAEYDPDSQLETIDFNDPSVISLVDRVTCEYTMDITANDGLYSVEIVTILDPGTYRHWSYIGEADPSDPNVIHLTGDILLATYNMETGELDEEIETEGVTATIVKTDDGKWLWYDDYANEGENSVFE